MKLLAIFVLISLTAVGQQQTQNQEVEDVLNTLNGQNIINKAVFDYAPQIALYQFDGDYSKERVFPGASPNTIICASPITFEKPVHSVIQKIDTVYEYSYYRKLIEEYYPIRWSEQALTLTKKITFINSRIGILLHREIGRITYPLFSKDGKTAFLTYFSVNRRSIIKKREVVYIMKKNEAGWQIVEVIDSKKI